MATLEDRLASLITAIGADIKSHTTSIAGLGTPKLYIPFMLPGLQFVGVGTLQIPVPVACTFSALVCRLATAPTGATTFKMDINYDGTSIWDTNQSNRPIWTASSVTPSYSTPDTTSYSAGPGHYFGFDIDAVGSTVVGSDLAGWLVVQP